MAYTVWGNKREKQKKDTKMFDKFYGKTKIMFNIHDRQKKN